MANGAQISEEHDRVLRSVPGVTGKPVAHWFKKLDEAGIQRRGFLAALDFLRDNLRVRHQEASVLAWSFFNPSMVPDDLMSAARAASGVVEKHTIDPLARRAAAAGGEESVETGTGAERSAPGAIAKGRSARAAKKVASMAAARAQAPAPSRKRAAAKPTAGKQAALKEAASKPPAKKAAGKRAPARPAASAKTASARKPGRRTPARETAGRASARKPGRRTPARKPARRR